ncbi:hypothetical protein CDBH8_0727 [Corynebacterium diphtheriae BH8]|uniref:hypothetical protein n=1 Tax=Corynebacterium diphtheriae TaxID=1717 RepID=UPI000245B8C5|nr:hypothetical protein [Corynebacterium diphtheriae]AEX48252.1 hypothetical protein CDBH8_0727 [Corynebacterium diphtheriae BH8]AEX80658.1 hypothetical protein CDHC04_0665 [Corynebacterium diphtheriae HC04]CAB1005620.1 hypothetical protein FRC0529_00757 [Corynebacterium diphtheriae]
MLRDRGDQRGLFGAGLDAVEANAVLPFQKSTFDPSRPVIARISLNLITSYWSAVHAEFSGGQPPAHRKRYFDSAVADCGSPSVALTAYNAHLTVDLAYAVKASGATWTDFGVYQDLVGAIAAQSDAIIKQLMLLMASIWVCCGVGFLRIFRFTIFAGTR